VLTTSGHLGGEAEDIAVGKLLIVAGLMLVAAGVLGMLGERLSLGGPPGDIVLRGARSAFYFPVATCLLPSLLLSLVLWLA
jgi:hypothetical protein